MTSENHMPTLEDIMSYADGVLDDDAAAAVEAAAQTNPDIREQINAFKASRSMVSDALSDALNGPVPSHLVDLVRGNQTPQETIQKEGLKQGENVVRFEEFKAKERTLPHIFKGRWQPAIAASIALVALGITLPSGLLSPDGSALQVAEGPLEAGSVLDRALSARVSGQSVQIDEDTSLILVASYATDQGFCREFDIASEALSTAALACKSTGGWQVVSVEDSPLSSNGRPVPASGADGANINDALASRKAGDALSNAAEAQAIANGWN